MVAVWRGLETIASFHIDAITLNHAVGTILSDVRSVDPSAYVGVIGTNVKDSRYGYSFQVIDPFTSSSQTKRLYPVWGIDKVSFY
jgi:hypothetical protein